MLRYSFAKKEEKKREKTNKQTEKNLLHEK